MAWDRHWTRSAEARGIVARFAVAGFASAEILAFGTLLIVRAILAGGGCDLDESFGSNARLEMLLVTGAAILGVEIVAFGFHLAPAALRRGNLSRASPTAARRRSGRPRPHRALRVYGRRARLPFVSRGLDQGMIWALFPRLDETANHMFFVVATARAYIVPKRDLPPGLISRFAISRGRTAS